MINVETDGLVVVRLALIMRVYVRRRSFFPSLMAASEVLSPDPLEAPPVHPREALDCARYAGGSHVSLALAASAVGPFRMAL
jgi:hypothetical protein